MLKIARRCYDEMIKDAEAGVPNEACGLLAGKGEIAMTFYRMTNTDQSPVSYLMDPKEQFQVMKRMRTAGERILGVYHSHVASQAYPSQKDVSFAFYPDVHYVIVTLKDRQRPAARAFCIEEEKIREDSLEIV